MSEQAREETYYKILKSGKACHGGDYRYPRGRWTEELHDLVACEHGYHVVTAEQVIDWLYDCDEVWRVDVGGEHIDHGNKHVFGKIRLAERVMDEGDMRNFAADCAESVLHLHKQQYPGDMTLDVVLNTVRAHAAGEAAADELAAAGAAAWAAAGAAAWAAAWDAAGDAAGDAAWDVAWAAARAVAWAAAGDAAKDVAWAAARAAQTENLARYLRGESDGE